MLNLYGLAHAFPDYCEVLEFLDGSLLSVGDLLLCKKALGKIVRWAAAALFVSTPIVFHFELRTIYLIFP